MRIRNRGRDSSAPLRFGSQAKVKGIERKNSGAMWFEARVGHLRVVLGREATDGAAVHNDGAEHPHKGAEVEQPAQRDAAGVVPLAFSHLRRKRKRERL